MKKVLSIILCLAMLMSCFALLASAETDTAVSTGIINIDGKISEGEYTASKVYKADANLQWQWTGSRGVTLTEYGAQDADYVYFALVYDVELSTIEIMMNGSAEVRDDWDSAARYGWFTFNNIDAAGVDATFLAYKFGDLDYIACARTEDGKTVAELMISKESMLTAYELDTLDYFGYYARAWMTDGKEINNGTWIAFQAFEDNGWGFGNESGFAEGYGLGDWYTTQGWTLMNIVILSDETLPENPAIFCPAGDDCTNPDHANRAEIFDLADLRCFGLLPGLFVPVDHKKAERVPVKANSEVVSNVADIYAVDISFGSMEFTCEINNVWKPAIHAFEGRAQWVCTTDANKISVVNHSSVAINAALTYTQGAGYEAISGAFDNSKIELDTAVNTAYDNAPASRAYLTLTGEYKGDDDFVTVGTVTVVITKA